jgi:hypothetical protein
MNKPTSDKTARPSTGRPMMACAGQAMIEFLLGLVGIAVLVAMLVQINAISLVHTPMVISTRNQMASMLAGNPADSSGSAYLSGWESGPDGFRYTPDDSSAAGDSGSFINGMESATHRDELLQVLQARGFAESDFSRFGSGAAGNVTESFGMFSHGQTDSIDFALIVQKLVTGWDTLQFRHDIYMPRINSLMESSGTQPN